MVFVTLAKGWPLDNPKEQCCPLPLDLLTLLPLASPAWTFQCWREEDSILPCRAAVQEAGGNTQAPWTWHWSWLLALKERGSWTSRCQLSALILPGATQVLQFPS